MNDERLDELLENIAQQPHNPPKWLIESTKIKMRYSTIPFSFVFLILALNLLWWISSNIVWFIPDLMLINKTILYLLISNFVPASIIVLLLLSQPRQLGTMFMSNDISRRFP